MGFKQPPESTVRARLKVVLFVDDDEDARALYGDALRRAGFIVDEAGGVDAAIASVHRYAPDLVLLDRHLLDGDGWDVARALRMHAGTRATTIVGFTANRSRDDVERALVAGCDAFLAKPCPTDALVQHVRGMLGMPLDDDDGKRRLA